MARFSLLIAYCLLMSGSVVLCSCALVGHHHNSIHRTRASQNGMHQPPRPLSCIQSSKQSNDQSTAAASPSPGKSPESNFWIAIQKNTTSSNDIPAVHGIDLETGPLPPGAYRNIDENVAVPCLIAVGIQPPLTLNAKEREDVWEEGVKNCQKLIDSGLNTFRVNSVHVNKKQENNINGGKKRRPTPTSVALEHLRQRTLKTESRHETEANFYRTLRQSTPSSVLRSCHLMVNLEIPSILAEDEDSVISRAWEEISTVPFGNGWMVRESVSNALLRTKGEYLDSVVLEYNKHSPYHLDVLDTLFEMKREGIIQSISAQNFPPSMLMSAMSSGFNVQSNDVVGNLMNTNNLHSDSNCSRLISGPLGGGLFTNQFCQYKEWARMSASSRKRFNTLIDDCCVISNGAKLDTRQKWEKYRSIMDTLLDISLKHQVSVESVALRWLLQLNEGDSISVNTQMGMDFVEEQGGQPYSRQRNLRQVFTFSLEEDNMERLCDVSGYTSEKNPQYGMDGEHEIDFTNRSLWI